MAVVPPAGGVTGAKIPASGYFVVPSGEAGQIKNAVDNYAATAAGRNGILQAAEGDIEAVVVGAAAPLATIGQYLAAASSGSGGYSVYHATSQLEVALLEQEGLTYYSTSSAAQTAANAKTATSNAANRASSSAANPLDYLSGIATFFSDLTNPQMWFRIGKILLGAALLLIGAVQISHLGQVVTGAAKKAATA